MSYENLDYKNDAASVLYHGADRAERRKWLDAGVDPELTTRAAFHAGTTATATTAETQTDQQFDVTAALQQALEQRG